MPNCFQLTRIGEQEPMVLAHIDNEMREHFKAPADAKEWFHGWYNYIGFMLAMGKNWQWLEQEIDGECLSAKGEDQLAYWSLMRDILSWLKERFTYDAFVEIGRR